MGANKLTGTVWHVESLERKDNRRHSHRCIHYDKKDKRCDKKVLKCEGARFCEYYEEEQIIVK